MKKRLKKLSFLKWPKTVIGSIIVIIVLVSIGGFLGYRHFKNEALNDLKQSGIEMFENKQYDKAETTLDMYIKKGGDDEEVKEVVKIIKVYEETNNLFQKGDYDKASSTLKEMPDIYLRYSIVNDVKSLDENIKKNQSEEKDFYSKKSNVNLNKYRLNNAINKSGEIITVVSIGDTRAELILWEKDDKDNWIQKDRMLARIGKNGMKDASQVYEGDKCTPTGIYTITQSFGHDENPGTKLPYRVLDGSEYWVDDPNSKYYNTMQFGDSDGRWDSAEDLSGVGMAYNYVAVINYNMNPVVPGKSSAIFLHVDNGFPTEGCVAVKEEKMIEILKWLNPDKKPLIILAPSYEKINSFSYEK